MKVIITAGGTGGHIYPALAIANKIKEKDKNAEILYIGTTKRMEKDIVPKAGYDYVGINVEGLRRSLSPSNIKSGILFAYILNVFLKINVKKLNNKIICNPLIANI